jgi:glycosyltransferase involved in cell wall biosynthesis
VTFVHLKTFSTVTTIGMTQLIKAAARRADALVAASAAARDQICATFGLDPARMAVIPNGPGRPRRLDATPEATLSDRYDLNGRRVVLCVAAKRPHKNQELLVRAMAKLPDDWSLVLAGHPEPYDADLRRLAAERGVAGRVRFVDYVSDEDFEGLAGLAGCIAVPTLAEGFGLPVLEAMRRGVPVACSDIPVLREVAGNAARYFDPRDPREAASAIRAAYGDEALAEAGRAQAARFSWDAAAEGTWEAYERAVAARAA